MATALDSSVLVAALSAWHARHAEARRAVAALLGGDERPIVPAHALAEAFSVLTRLPPGYRISPRDAQRLLSGALRGRVRVASERSSAAWALLEDAVARDVAGGAVYDLRILRAARSVGATTLLTLDADDFQRFEIDDVTIVEP